MQYSHSRLSAYEDCPRKFAFRYIEKIEVDTEGIEAFMGKRVHEILERLYHHVARYGRPPSLRQVLDRFRSDWEAQYHGRIRIVREDQTADGYVERGMRCLENYYRAHYPFTDGDSVGIEQRVHLRLDAEGRYKLVGIIDRVVARGAGCYEIHDYKTGARLPRQKDVDRERQLALYQIGLEQTYDDVREVELVWHYLQHRATLRSRRTREDLDALRDATIQLIDAIEAASEYPARTGPLCRWCEYRELCPAMRGGDVARERAEEELPLGDGPLSTPPPAVLGPTQPLQLSLLE